MSLKCLFKKNVLIKNVQSSMTIPKQTKTKPKPKINQENSSNQFFHNWLQVGSLP